MTYHKLKIQKKYAIAKLEGVKPFEIRYDDRCFKVGDIVSYEVLDDKELNEHFRYLLYEIVYISDYEQKKGYVVFAEKLIHQS